MDLVIKEASLFRRITARSLVVLAILAALTSASFELGAAGNRKDIVGRVVGLAACARGSTADPCPRRPLFFIRVVLKDDAGVTVARTRTHLDGRFSFRADPGSYSIEGEGIQGFLAAPAEQVTVTRGQDEPQRALLRFTSSNGPGVAGQATMSPTCGGPQREGQDCTAAFDGAHVKVEDDTGQVVASAVTGLDGYYSFALEAGTYTLIAEGDGNQLPSPPPPKTFTVGTEDTGPHWRRLDYDTGIR